MNHRFMSNLLSNFSVVKSICVIEVGIIQLPTRLSTSRQGTVFVVCIEANRNGATLRIVWIEGSN